MTRRPYRRGRARSCEVCRSSWQCSFQPRQPRLFSVSERVCTVSLVHFLLLVDKGERFHFLFARAKRKWKKEKARSGEGISHTSPPPRPPPFTTTREGASAPSCGNTPGEAPPRGGESNGGGPQPPFLVAERGESREGNSSSQAPYRLAFSQTQKLAHCAARPLQIKAGALIW